MDLIASAEPAISTASVHGIGVHLATEFCSGFGDEAGQPHDAVECGRFRWQFRWRDDAIAALALLNGEEEVAPSSGDEQSGLESGLVPVGMTVIFDEVKELALAASNGSKKRKIVGGKPGGIVLLSGVVETDAAVKERAKIGGPSVVFHA